MASLKSIEGGFSETSKYNLKVYEDYLTKLVKQVVKVQNNVRKVSNQIKGTVMVRGKWYDDAAAKFAQWWNNNTSKEFGLADGVDRLNNISTVVEELVRITAVNVCVQMKNSKKLGKSSQKHEYIQKFSNGDVYIYGIENITKKTLGNIQETECDANAEMLADKQSLETMINNIAVAFDNINEAIQKIENLIKDNLIEGKAALKLKGLSPDLLNSKVTKVKGHMNAINDGLYNILKTDQSENNLTDNQLKQALSTNYLKSNGKLHLMSKHSSTTSSDYNNLKNVNDLNIGPDTSNMHPEYKY